MVYGDVKLGNYTPEGMKDPKVLALADRVSVRADSAAAPAEIDAAAAEAERAKAEEEMKTAGVDTLDAIRARFELAQARLAVSRRPN